jgi:hypothetical protein
MHATHTDPRRILIAAMAALVLALVAATLLSALGDLNLSTGSDQSISVQPSASTSAASPAWVTNPVASPLTEFRTPTP